MVFTGQEIIVGNADYPTEKIAENTRAFRQLGIGYANLGALLMAQGLPYDSAAGRAWAAALTALLTGHAYATSARTSARMGPFAGYHENAEPMLNVLRMHQQEAANIDEDVVPPRAALGRPGVLGPGGGAGRGLRRAQLPSERFGADRLPGRGDARRRRSRAGPPAFAGRSRRAAMAGPSDTGRHRRRPRDATKFYVNGSEAVVTVETARGTGCKGRPPTGSRWSTPNRASGSGAGSANSPGGELVPLALGALVGEPQEVPLPPLAEAYWTGERHLSAPRQMTPELAELIGYFMGDGSLHSRGLRFCVADSDFDVVERLQLLSKSASAPVPR